jgi:AcrR family transcriptional regulator
MRAPRQPPRTPNRVQQRTPRQTELLDQLEELFLREGFAHLTLDDIVSELRCSKMTLYTLAPSREQLILAVLRRYFEQAGDRINDHLAHYRTSSRRIRAVLEATNRELRRMTPASFKDVIGYSTTHELYETFATSCAQRLLEVLTKVPNAANENLATGRFLSEVARLVFDEMLTGDLEQRTGLDPKGVLEHLIRLIQSTGSRSGGRSGVPIELVTSP